MQVHESDSIGFIDQCQLLHQIYVMGTSALSVSSHKLVSSIVIDMTYDNLFYSIKLI